MYVVKGRVRKSARGVLLCHPVTSILVEVCMVRCVCGTLSLFSARSPVLLRECLKFLQVLLLPSKTFCLDVCISRTILSPSVGASPFFSLKLLL